MQRPLLIPIISSASLILMLAGPPAIAGDSHDYLMLADLDIDAVRQLKESGEIMPLETILRGVQKIQPGRVIEVELDDDDDRYIYEMEVLDENGVVWDIDIDAHSGELLERERDD